MTTKSKGEKKQHIQVFTRVRPLNSQELRSQVVVECISSKEVSVRDKSQTKTFTFDRVFGPHSKQVEVYKAVVSPLIAEVLQGYNCTVFAYGQTGTGKTFTMVGEKSENSSGSWEDDPSCGVIPRTLSHLFDELKVRADEFTVRVSFLELYNEELCDLLAPNVNDDGKSLKLFEDSIKKGSVIVSGLEERTVHNKDDVYAILEAGNLRRQTAPTLMNAQSSRSHTIFTITVHIKVTTPEGEDLIKTGKLNLVDLAGSENIGRSGAVEMRAREAGSINQSLLTLGRVITSLVERTPHIPYRESKLTRILQDSLGGRTKTSIIATVSPAFCNIEETLSTFDYAHRARNITNKPEINQKTSKRVLLKEYTEEIERLRRDLIATREKHGVYLASENYNAIIAEKDNLNKELVSKLQLLKVREDELAKQEEIMKSLNMSLFETQNELALTSQKLEAANKLCDEKEDMLHELGLQTNALLKTADEAVNDAKTLHDRLAVSRKILDHNFTSAQKFKNNLCRNLGNMKTRTKEFLATGINEIDSQKESDEKFISSLISNQMLVQDMTNKMIKSITDQIQSTFEIIVDQTISNQNFLSEQLTELQSVVGTQNEKAQEIISGLTNCSLKFKTNWETLFNKLELNKLTLEQQNDNIQVVQKNLMELTQMISALPVVYNEKLKLREEALKTYAEKCEFLENKQSNMRKQIDEFGRNLYQMVQDHVELLQRENECEEALKTIRNDRQCEEESLLSEIMDALQVNTNKMNKHATEIEKMNERVGEAANTMLQNTSDTILPILNQIAATEDEFVRSAEELVKDNALLLENRLVKLQKVCETESKKVSKFSEVVDNRTTETMGAVGSLSTYIDDNCKSTGVTLEGALKANAASKEKLTSDITEYSNDVCSNVRDRVKEIETFFSENIKKDEKTGNTPQRKEFSYPRNILQFSNKKSELAKHIQAAENNVIDEDLSENKENITEA
ncbi:hypothetical protein RUM44_012893 [Polyplax serrata]|uniref:Kinesin-like protein n=1 Tax=Polyplax serrata TaxID=468196 RepID=A0ABR1BGK8_POLSC